MDPRVGKIPRKKKWQPIPVFLSGKSHGQRSLADYGPWHHKSQTHLTKPPPPATWESNREPAVKKKKKKKLKCKYAKRCVYFIDKELY